MVQESFLQKGFLQEISCKMHRVTLILTIFLALGLIGLFGACCKLYMLYTSVSYKDDFNVTEAGVTQCCSSAAVDDSVDCVILRGG